MPLTGRLPLLPPSRGRRERRLEDLLEIQERKPVAPVRLGTLGNAKRAREIWRRGLALVEEK